MGGAEKRAPTFRRPHVDFSDWNNHRSQCRKIILPMWE
jgi:hypothetical protein